MRVSPNAKSPERERMRVWAAMALKGMRELPELAFERTVILPAWLPGVGGRKLMVTFRVALGEIVPLQFPLKPELG